MVVGGERPLACTVFGHRWPLTFHHTHGGLRRCREVGSPRVRAAGEGTGVSLNSYATHFVRESRWWVRCAHQVRVWIRGQVCGWW